MATWAPFVLECQLFSASYVEHATRPSLMVGKQTWLNVSSALIITGSPGPKTTTGPNNGLIRTVVLNGQLAFCEPFSKPPKT